MEYPDIRQCPVIGYDTETTGLRYKVDKVFGFSIAVPGGGDYYWDIRENPESVSWFNDQMREYKGKIVAQNVSFDYRMSHHTGIYLPLEQMEDTVIIACQIDEHLFSYDLDNLASKYLKRKKETDIYHEMSALFGGLPTRNVQISRISQAPSHIVAPYGKSDARLVLDLWTWQQGEILSQGIRQIVDFEMSKMPTFIRAEMRGIRVDQKYAEQAIEKLTPIIDEKQSELNSIFNADVNVNSSPQIKKLFAPVEIAEGVWVTKDGTPIGTTSKGGPSLKADFLREMDTPESNLILEIRSLLKTRDTFLGTHVLKHAIGGRVYPTINQSKGEDGGTGTGRLSYVDPAMQQIPSRNKKIAAIVKPSFLPDEGQVWVDADMASFEVRVFAHLINNPKIIEAYRKNPNTDFHQWVSEITGLVRNATYSGQPNAKQLNLSMIFNSGDGAIAKKMGMPWTHASFTKYDDTVVNYIKAGPEAKAIIDMYHERLDGSVKKLAKGCKDKAEERGYIFTRDGRRLRFPRGYKSYKASGLLIQATAADINKRNWKVIEEQLDGVGHLILNTHDSYSMSLPEDWLPHYNRVSNEIQNYDFRVPLILEFSGVGINWWDALSKKPKAKTNINMQRLWKSFIGG